MRIQLIITLAIVIKKPQPSVVSCYECHNPDSDYLLIAVDLIHDCYDAHAIVTSVRLLFGHICYLKSDFHMLLRDKFLWIPRPSREENQAK